MGFPLKYAAVPPHFFRYGCTACRPVCGDDLTGALGDDSNEGSSDSVLGGSLLAASLLQTGLMDSCKGGHAVELVFGCALRVQDSFYRGLEDEEKADLLSTFVTVACMLC